MQASAADRPPGPEPTIATSTPPGRPRDQSLRYARLPEEDATRMSDVDALVAKERERARAGRPAPARPPPPSRSSVHDEATRAVDIGRTASISDVDWDLD